MSDSIFVLNLTNPIFMAKNDNPIVENYRGVNIRQYPRVYIRVSIYEMKRIIDLKLDKGLTEKEAIKNNNVLCATSPTFEIRKIKGNE